MPYWYYEKDELKNTPSKRDGVDYETEKRYRREATNFIKECGNLMGLGYSTIHTAIVYLHRFYQFHSFKTFPRFVTACACLFLAGKVEETPKKCKDIIKKASTLLSPSKMASFGEDPKEEVITMERILLKTIKFDLQVDHPYRFLIEYAKSLKSNGSIPKEQVVQKAWNFINDSLETTLCLQWEPEIIAVAMMYLATKISKYDVVDWKGRLPEHQKWWDVFVKDMTKNILDEICHQVLDLYQKDNKNRPEPPDSPPQMPPSKATIAKIDQPPMKRAKLQQSPNYNAKIGTNQIPVKVSSNDYDMSKVPIHQYNYPAYQGGPPYLMPPVMQQPPLPSYPNNQIHPPMPAMQQSARYSSNYYPPPQQPPLPPSSNNYPPPHKNNNSRSSNNSNNFPY